jgi:hypothetical protein
MGVSDQRHAPAALYPRENNRYPLDRRLGGPQSQSGLRLEEKSFASAGDHILINASMKFGKKKFRYVIPAYTGPFQGLDLINKFRAF